MNLLYKNNLRQIILNFNRFIKELRALTIETFTETAKQL